MCLRVAGARCERRKALGRGIPLLVVCNPYLVLGTVLSGDRNESEFGNRSLRQGPPNKVVAAVGGGPSSTLQQPPRNWRQAVRDPGMTKREPLADSDRFEDLASAYQTVLVSMLDEAL